MRQSLQIWAKFGERLEVVTFDGLVEVVPVLPRCDVGGFVLSPPQEDALILRPARKILSVVAAIKRKEEIFKIKTHVIVSQVRKLEAREQYKRKILIVLLLL